MKNIISKIIMVLIIISTLIVYIPTVSNAGWIDEIFKDAKDFLDTPVNTAVTNRVDDDKIIDTSMYIYNILVTVGIIIAAVVILVLGIQIMTGSIEQKAKAKEMLIPFIVGVVIIFGSLAIWRFIANFASTIG